MIDKEHEENFNSFEEFWLQKLNNYDHESQDMVHKTMEEQDQMM